MPIDGHCGRDFDPPVLDRGRDIDPPVRLDELSPLRDIDPGRGVSLRIVFQDIFSLPFEEPMPAVDSDWEDLPEKEATSTAKRALRKRKSVNSPPESSFETVKERAARFKKSRQSKMSTRHSPKSTPKTNRPQGHRPVPDITTPGVPDGGNPFSQFKTTPGNPGTPTPGAVTGEKEKGSSDTQSDQLAAMMAEMKALTGQMKGMEGRLRDDIHGVEEGVDSKLGAAFRTLEERVEKNEKNLPALVTSIVDDALNTKLKGILPAISRAPRTPKDQDSQREERYWTARRSLRMWPLPGSNPRKEVEIFVLSRLGLGTEFVNSMGPVTCRPTGSTRPANIKNEYSVTFTSKAVRDAVRGAASRLGACAEP